MFVATVQVSDKAPEVSKEAQQAIDSAIATASSSGVPDADTYPRREKALTTASMTELNK